jgi:hypothetical protein
VGYIYGVDNSDLAGALGWIRLGRQGIIELGIEAWLGTI